MLTFFAGVRKTFTKSFLHFTAAALRSCFLVSDFFFLVLKKLPFDLVRQFEMVWKPIFCFRSNKSPVVKDKSKLNVVLT